MKQILFFSPYMPWTPHLLWEVTLAYALRQRGHNVKFAACGGLPDCGVAPARMERMQITCEECRKFTTIMLPQTFRLQGEFFQESLTAEDKGAIEAWVMAIPSAELQTACYRGLPLGEWVWPDMISYWHSLEPDLSRPQIADTYRNYLRGAAEAATALPRVYDAFQPDVLVTLNGTFFLHRVAVELAKARGVRVVTHERGWRNDTVVFNAEAFVNDISQYRQQWGHWKDVPLTTEELHAVEKLLTQRRRGLNMNWVGFSPSPQDIRAVREAANLPDKPIALLCTSSDCEGSLYDRERNVPQMEWIEQTIDWFRAHPEYTLVIRVHPNELEHAKVDDRLLRRYEMLSFGLPENVRLILPEEQVSTYSLMDIASVGLVYGSTAGLEMACQGIPVIHAGIGIYKNAGFTHELTSLEQLPDLMARVMTLSRDPETKRRAYRFVSRIFHSLCVPIRGVKVGNDFVSATLTYDSVAELAPGRDTDLDRTAAYILGEGELYPPPTPEQTAQTEERENRFFAEQRAGALLAAAQEHPDRADLLFEAADALRALGLEAEAVTVQNTAERVAAGV
jgi:hypothetical protein